MPYDNNNALKCIAWPQVYISLGVFSHVESDSEICHSIQHHYLLVLHVYYCSSHYHKQNLSPGPSTIRLASRALEKSRKKELRSSKRIFF